MSRPQMGADLFVPNRSHNLQPPRRSPGHVCFIHRIRITIPSGPFCTSSSATFAPLLLRLASCLAFELLSFELRLGAFSTYTLHHISPNSAPNLLSASLVGADFTRGRLLLLPGFPVALRPFFAFASFDSTVFDSPRCGFSNHGSFSRFSFATGWLSA